MPAGDDEASLVFSDAVKRTAMSIEIFHKASLVHDDIEDDDPYRYGRVISDYDLHLHADEDTGRVTIEGTFGPPSRPDRPLR